MYHCIPFAAGLTMHASILAYMFSIVESNQITSPLSASQAGQSNDMYVKDFTAGLLKSAFPHLQE